ncbi:MAG: lipid-A-disaccharide synthase [Sphingobacteriaceae bacterium]
MRYYLIAGEASGDLHGANLMKALKQQDPKADFRYFGGDLMKAEGGVLAKHYADMAFMGFVEVVLHLSQVLRNLKTCKNDLKAWQPDVLILIDFPGFNLKIADFATKEKIPVFYYISPKVWAWNQKRVLKIKKVVDRMFCILPFEVDFYRKWGMEVDYIGNPLLDAITSYAFDADFLDRHKINDKPIVALLPGSRKQEILRILPDMIAAAAQLPEAQFVIAGAPTFNPDFYQSFIGTANIPVVFNATYDLLKHATAAVVASGTATLETAIFRVPQVVVYKGNPVSIAIARMLVNIKYISLVNLIVDKPVVKELIQGECTAMKISKELNAITIDKKNRFGMLASYEELGVIMGETGASARAASLMVGYLKKNEFQN